MGEAALAERLVQASREYADRVAITRLSRGSRPENVTFRELMHLATHDGGGEPSDLAGTMLLQATPTTQFVVRFVRALLKGDSVVLQSSSARRSPSSNIAARTPAGSVILYTSGTGAAPLGIRHTQETLANAIMRTPLLATGDTQVGFVVPIDFSHIGGVFVLLRALLTGDRMVIPASAHPRHLFSALAETGARVVGVPPPLARLLTRAQVPPGLDPSTLVVNLATMPTTRQLVGDLVSSLGCLVGISYGATELGGPIALGLLTIDSPYGLVGQPLAGVDIRVVRDDGTPCAHDELGNLLCRSDQLFASYYPSLRLPTLEDGFFRTNDAAAIGADGTLSVFGRLDDVILRAGNRVTPEEIEQALEQHPGIVAAGVVNIADPSDLDAVVVGFLVAADGRRPPTPESILSFCAQVLPPVMRPQAIVFVDELPRTPNGKLRRSLLRAHPVDVSSP